MYKKMLKKIYVKKWNSYLKKILCLKVDLLEKNPKFYPFFIVTT